MFSFSPQLSKFLEGNAWGWAISEVLPWRGKLYPWWDIPWGWAKGHPLTLWPRVDRSEVDPGPTLGLLPLGFQELFSLGCPLRGPSSQDKGVDPREMVSLFPGQGAGLEQSRAEPYQCSQNRVSLRGLCLYPGLFFYDQEAEVPYRRPLTLSLSPSGDVSSHSLQTVDPLGAVRVTLFFLCGTPAEAGCP